MKLCPYLFISQRNEMSPSQDPPQPLPQRPDGQPGLGGELRSAGERQAARLCDSRTWLPHNR